MWSMRLVRTWNIRVGTNGAKSLTTVVIRIWKKSTSSGWSCTKIRYVPQDSAWGMWGWVDLSGFVYVILDLFPRRNIWLARIWIWFSELLQGQRFWNSKRYFFSSSPAICNEMLWTVFLWRFSALTYWQMTIMNETPVSALFETTNITKRTIIACFQNSRIVFLHSSVRSMSYWE